MDLDLLVIGATSAGWHSAITAAQAGLNVGLTALPSRRNDRRSDLRTLSDEFLHDACADWPLLRPLGTVTSRAAAASWREFANTLAQNWSLSQEFLQEELIASNGSIWRGAVELLDPHSAQVTTARGRTKRIAAQHILLATGTRSVRPRFATTDLPGVHNAARLLEASAIPREATMIGASVTGLRSACLLAWWGSQVTLIDGKASGAELADESSIEWLTWAADLGVEFKCGEDVIALQSKSARQVDMLLESGRHLTSETVWLATGRNGNTDSLQLDRAGLSVDDRGRLWCDDRNRTWAESISAIGDVIGFCPEPRSEAEAAQEIAEWLLEPAHDRELMLA